MWSAKYSEDNLSECQFFPYNFQLIKIITCSFKARNTFLDILLLSNLIVVAHRINGSFRKLVNTNTYMKKPYNLITFYFIIAIKTVNLIIQIIIIIHLYYLIIMFLIRSSSLISPMILR